MVLVLSVVLVLGPQLNQLHAQLVMPVLVPLLVQLLPQPVLPVLVKTLDVKHAQITVLPHAHHALEVMPWLLVFVPNVKLVNMPPLEPKMHAQLVMLALGPPREQLHAPLVLLELPLLLVQFLLTPVLAVMAKMLDVSHALNLVKVSAQNVLPVMLWSMVFVPNVLSVIGLQLDQLHALPVLVLPLPLLAQLLLMPVLLVPMLDVLLVLMLPQTNARLVVQATI